MPREAVEPEVVNTSGLFSASTKVRLAHPGTGFWGEALVGDSRFEYKILHTRPVSRLVQTHTR